MNPAAAELSKIVRPESIPGLSSLLTGYAKMNPIDVAGLVFGGVCILGLITVAIVVKSVNSGRLGQQMDAVKEKNQKEVIKHARETANNPAVSRATRKNCADIVMGPPQHGQSNEDYQKQLSLHNIHRDPDEG